MRLVLCCVLCVLCAVCDLSLACSCVPHLRELTAGPCSEFYGVASEKVGLYLVPFAIGNFLGPITLGPLFDTIGRRQMIALTYSLSAVLLIITGTVALPPPSAAAADVIDARPHWRVRWCVCRVFQAGCSPEA